jgi:branched-chain amino acid transport system ATP-binding protein
MIEQNARRALEESDRGIVLVNGENRFSGTGTELLNEDEIIDAYM